MSKDIANQDKVVTASNVKRAFWITKLFYGISFVMLLQGCAPIAENTLNSAIINAHNDALFLTDGSLKCPSSLQGKTVRLQSRFDECLQPMAMEALSLKADGSMEPISFAYNGSWQDDVTNTIKRNLATACDTKFSDQPNTPSIDLKFKKLTSQILSIDQKSETKDFNLISLDSRYDYNYTTNYVMDVEVGGSLFEHPLKYAKGLQRKQSGHQISLGKNYLLTISTHAEGSRVVDVSILPENYLLYAQKTAEVMDMRTVVVPIFSNEMIIDYKLYSPSGEIRSKKSLSMQAGEIIKNLNFTTVANPSDQALIDMFAGTGAGIGWINNAVVGPYAWLLYDFSQEIIKNVN
ncbi:hypothetical protein [Sulfurimonas sp.]|uniref:hypothetical protein n=1 Tax=Sulfurimonas sp. TaxID=2022749 RepID=UPI0025EFFE5E|nr:hypothetical protein [Sulfurimonas sp.]MDD5157758.1 hypothetical protein [Sulfurimonas sp.]